MNTKMNYPVRSFWSLTVIVVSFLTACSPGYEETEEGGLEYKIHRSEGGRTAEMGQIMEMNMVFRHGDSVISDSRNHTPVYMRIEEPAFRGDILEALPELGIGDSATFRVSADSMYGDFLPAYMEPGDFLNFDVGVRDIIDNEARINTFIEEHGYNFEQSEDGIYYEFVERGSGRTPQPRDTVVVEYTLQLLDGSEVVSSASTGRPGEYLVGIGHPIEGWDKLLFKMETGDRLRAIIPPELAYKEGGAEKEVPPFSPLYAEVELLEVK